MTSKNEFESFLSNQSSNGSWDSEGEFTANALKADKKLKDYHRSTPGKWIIKFVQAGVAAHSLEFAIKISKDSLELDLVTEKELAEAPLSDMQSEVSNYLRQGVQGLLCAEEHLETLSILSLGRGRGGVVTSLQSGQEAQVFPLDDSDLASAFGKRWRLKSNQAARLIVQVRMRKKTGSWLGRLRKGLEFRTNLMASLKGRLDDAPIPIILDGRRYGLGSSSKPSGTAATEFIFASRFQDCIVREKEPGHGFYHLDLFGRPVTSDTSFDRYFNRWCRVSHLLFGDIKEPVVDYQPKIGVPTRSGSLLSRSEFPDSEIPIFCRQEDADWLLKGILRVKPEFRVAPDRQKWLRQTPGFPVSVLIRVPSSPCPKKFSFLNFYRRGVLLERVPLELVYPGTKCDVACAAINTDFTGMRVVRDEQLDQLQKFLDERIKTLVLDTLRVAKRAGRDVRLAAMAEWARSKHLKVSQ